MKTEKKRCKVIKKMRGNVWKRCVENNTNSVVKQNLKVDYNSVTFYAQS